jgi:hypothetical protein
MRGRYFGEREWGNLVDSLLDFCFLTYAAQWGEQPRGD